MTESAGPKGQVQRWAAGTVAAALVLLLTAALVSRARSHSLRASDDAAAGYWGPKSVSVEEVPGRAQFRPVVPRALPADLRLVAVQMVWVEQDQFDLRLRPRQAIRFIYRGRRQHREFSITEAEHFAGLDPRDNIWPVLSQGYFEPDHTMQSLLSVGTISDTDFVIVSDGLSQQELVTVKASLAPLDIGR